MKTLHIGSKNYTNEWDEEEIKNIKLNHIKNFDKDRHVISTTCGKNLS